MPNRGAEHPVLLCSGTAVGFDYPKLGHTHNTLDVFLGKGVRWFAPCVVAQNEAGGGFAAEAFTGTLTFSYISDMERSCRMPLPGEPRWRNTA
jgi:hypothetical protein